MASRTQQRIWALVLAFSLVGCSASDVPLAKVTTGRDPTVAEVPNKDETVRGDTDPAIVTLDLGSSLREHRLTVADDLPGNIIIPTTNFNAVPITAALQAVLSGTDVSLSWNTGALGTRLVTVMNLSGPLPKVVEKICSAAKVFCDYRHGSLELAEKETFVVSLPPMVRPISGGSSSSSSSSSSAPISAIAGAGGANSMVETINTLIASQGSDGKVATDASKAQVDEQGGNIVYTTTVDGQDRVAQYLVQLRTGRPLVVLQMYLWEVTLNYENAQGVNWTQLNVSTIDKSFNLSSPSNLNTVATTAGSVSLGAVTSGIISAKAVASFLATKGRLQTISNPQITFVSGSSAQLKVGGTKRYISQVGALTTANNASGTGASSNSNTNASTNTVSTDSIDTGLSINVAGSYENGIVFADIDVSLKNLLGLHETASGGGTIDLPETSDQKLNTVLRVRPGDSLILAGLVTSADTQNSQGLPLGFDSALPLYGDEQRQNHELIMIVRPSVILFSEKSATEEAKKKENAKPLPDALVIDKEGARVLTLPKTPEATAPVPLQNVATTPVDNDGAPVDKLLMQRGFSHAFDQMLQNPAGGGAP